MKKKSLFVILIVAFCIISLVSFPGQLFAVGATYDATGGANWNSYVGYGSHITATFNVTATPDSSAILTVHAYDVDEEQGELDGVYFIETDGTEHFLGYLSGQNGIWNTSSFPLNKDWVKVGTNSIRIEPDVNNDGWAVNVDKAQLVIDGGVASDANITNLSLDNYDNTGANVSLNSTVDTLIGTIGSYKIETNLIDSNTNNLGTFFYNFTTTGPNEVVSRTTNFTYDKSLPSGTFTINAFLFDSGDTLQSARSITFQHEQDVGIVSVASSSVILVPEEVMWIRDRDMKCHKVWINENNNFEFVFFWEYKNNSWVMIYDMDGNEVFSIDMEYGKARFEADLPDGMYTVKTFHEEGKILQEFIIGKPAPEM